MRSRILFASYPGSLAPLSDYFKEPMFFSDSEPVCLNVDLYIGEDLSPSQIGLPGLP